MLRAHPALYSVQDQPFNFSHVPNQVGILPPCSSSLSVILSLFDIRISSKIMSISQKQDSVNTFMYMRGGP